MSNGGRLADFCLSTIAGVDNHPAASKEPLILFTDGDGTTRWMSLELLDPERFGISNGRPTKRSDCYALGMAVYKVLKDVYSPPPIPHLHGGLTCVPSGSLWKASLLGDHEWSSDNARVTRTQTTRSWFIVSFPNPRRCPITPRLSHPYSSVAAARQLPRCTVMNLMTHH